MFRQRLKGGHHVTRAVNPTNSVTNSTVSEHVGQFNPGSVQQNSMDKSWDWDTSFDHNQKIATTQSIPTANDSMQDAYHQSHNFGGYVQNEQFSQTHANPSNTDSLQASSLEQFQSSESQFVNVPPKTHTSTERPSESWGWENENWEEWSINNQKMLNEQASLEHHNIEDQSYQKTQFVPSSTFFQSNQHTSSNFESGNGSCGQKEEITQYCNVNDDLNAQETNLTVNVHSEPFESNTGDMQNAQYYQSHLEQTFDRNLNKACNHLDVAQCSTECNVIMDPEVLDNYVGNENVDDYSNQVEIQENNMNTNRLGEHKGEEKDILPIENTFCSTANYVGQSTDSIQSHASVTNDTLSFNQPANSEPHSDILNSSSDISRPFEATTHGYNDQFKIIDKNLNDSPINIDVYFGNNSNNFNPDQAPIYENNPVKLDWDDNNFSDNVVAENSGHKIENIVTDVHAQNVIHENIHELKQQYSQGCEDLTVVYPSSNIPTSVNENLDPSVWNQQSFEENSLILDRILTEDKDNANLEEDEDAELVKFDSKPNEDLPNTHDEYSISSHSKFPGNDQKLPISFGGGSELKHKLINNWDDEWGDGWDSKSPDLSQNVLPKGDMQVKLPDAICDNVIAYSDDADYNKLSTDDSGYNQYSFNNDKVEESLQQHISGKTSIAMLNQGLQGIFIGSDNRCDVGRISSSPYSTVTQDVNDYHVDSTSIQNYLETDGNKDGHPIFQTKAPLHQEHQAIDVYGGHSSNHDTNSLIDLTDERITLLETDMKRDQIFQSDEFVPSAPSSAQFTQSFLPQNIQISNSPISMDRSSSNRSPSISGFNQIKSDITLDESIIRTSVSPEVCIAQAGSAGNCEDEDIEVVYLPNVPEDLSQFDARAIGGNKKTFQSNVLNEDLYRAEVSSGISTGNDSSSSPESAYNENKYPSGQKKTSMGMQGDVNLVHSELLINSSHIKNVPPAKPQHSSAPRIQPPTGNSCGITLRARKGSPFQPPLNKHYATPVSAVNVPITGKENTAFSYKEENKNREHLPNEKYTMESTIDEPALVGDDSNFEGNQRHLGDNEILLKEKLDQEEMERKRLLGKLKKSSYGDVHSELPISIENKMVVDGLDHNRIPSKINNALLVNEPPDRSINLAVVHNEKVISSIDNATYSVPLLIPCLAKNEPGVLNPSDDSYHSNNPESSNTIGPSKIPIKQEISYSPPLSRMIPGESSKGSSRSTAFQVPPVVPQMPQGRFVTGNDNPQPLPTLLRVKAEYYEERSAPDGPLGHREQVGSANITHPIRSETIGSEEVLEAVGREKDVWEKDHWTKSSNSRRDTEGRDRDGREGHRRDNAIQGGYSFEYGYDRRSQRQYESESDSAEEMHRIPRQERERRNRHNRAYRDELDRYGEGEDKSDQEGFYRESEMPIDNRHMKKGRYPRKSLKNKYVASNEEDDPYYGGSGRSDRSRPGSQSSGFTNPEEELPLFTSLRPRDGLGDAHYKGDTRGRKKKYDPKYPYSRGPSGHPGYPDMYSDPQAYYYYYQQYYAKYYELQRNQYRDYQRQYYPSGESLMDERCRSGRSSVNGDLKKAPSVMSTDYYPSQPDTISPRQRETPPLFLGPHLSASFCSSGKMTMVLPSNPKMSDTYSDKSGQSRDLSAAIVQLRDVKKMFMKDREMMERIQCMDSFPGPLTGTDTHKDVVIRLCEQRAFKAAANKSLFDNESVSLFWEYLALLVKQNGKVCGADMSSILLKDSMQNKVVNVKNENFSRNEEEMLAEDATPDEMNANNLSPGLSPSSDELLQEFTALLCQGRRKEAVDYAIKNNLWGYAMTLAAKMDSVTHMKVMSAFVQSIPQCNVFQTLIQHLSGKKPDVTKTYCPLKWGSWRPHLSMLISNDSGQPQRDAASIIALGDTLRNRGQLHAAQLCYLLANAEWSSYADKDAKLVLLGASNKQNFTAFINEDSIQLTEVYEYARSLDVSNSSLVTFQSYKFIYALRLAECGFRQDALKYCEVISSAVNENPSEYKSAFVMQVFELASRLKYNDMHFEMGQGELSEIEDPEWLQKLQHNLHLIQYREQEEQQAVIKEEPVPTLSESVMDGDTHNTSNSNILADNVDNGHSYDAATNFGGFGMESNLSQQRSFDNEEEHSRNKVEFHQPNNQYNQPASLLEETDIKQENTTTDADVLNHTEQYQQYEWQHQPQQVPMQPEMLHQMTPSVEEHLEPTPPSWERAAEVPQWLPNDQPQIGFGNQYQPQFSQPPMLPPPVNESLPVQSAGEHQSWQAMEQKDAYPKDDSSLTATAPEPAENKVTETKLSKDGKEDDKRPGFLGSLFGGWRGKNNQAKLPDDRNPTIVWDEANKRWENKDGNEEADAPPPPPPKSQGPPPNIASFRGNSKKSRYVDPVGQKGRTKAPLPASSMLMPGVPPSMAMPPIRDIPAEVSPDIGREPMIPQSFSIPQPGENQMDRHRIHSESSSVELPESYEQPSGAGENAGGVPMASAAEAPPMFFNPATFQPRPVQSQPNLSRKPGPQRRFK